MVAVASAYLGGLVPGKVDFEQLKRVVAPGSCNADVLLARQHPPWVAILIAVKANER